MSEFVQDIRCPMCAFPHASQYRDEEGLFSDCGHCNFNTRRGDSPTPERVEVLDWPEMQAYLDAEREWLAVDSRFHDYFASTPEMLDEARWYALERDQLR